MKRTLSCWVALGLVVGMVGCEAEPLPMQPADPPPDAMNPEPEPAGCPDDDGDGYQAAACAATTGDCDDSDSRVRPGVPDPCGDGVDQDCDGQDPTCPPDCTRSEIEPCDDVDNDCDGVVDECAPGQQCEVGLCVSSVGSRCDVDTPCAAGLDCVEGQCTLRAPGGVCQESADCGADAICAANEGCDPGGGERCYALQGGRCTFDCDCAGIWLCDDIRERCVTCLNDGQCDAGACTGNGLCSTPTMISPDADALGALMQQVVTCWSRGVGQDDALGCAQLRTTALAYDGRGVEHIAPLDDADPRLCDVESIIDRGLTEDDARAVAELFGCAEAPHRVKWLESITANSDPAGCVSYLPEWADPAVDTPQVVIADCAELVFARQ